MEESNKDIKRYSPPSKENIKISNPVKKSVGIPSIVSSIGQMSKYMRPTDALKLSLNINQKNGFDCPGCAWPDPDDDRSALGEYCENGIKAIAEEASKNSIGESFFKKHSISELSSWSDFELGKSGRLTIPLFKSENSDFYNPISWEDAFDLIADELNKITPNEALFYTSGRTSNEAAFLYQLFVRAYGTNNLPDCSNMCHESSGVGLSQTLGIGKGSVTLEDLHKAELIIVMGQNPGTNHPRMLSALEKCKLNGGKIISVNPLPEAGLINFVNPQSPSKILSGGTTLTDLFLPIRLNGDVAFLQAIMAMLYVKEDENKGNVFDWEFIDQYTSGIEDLLDSLKNTDITSCLNACGISLDLAEIALEMILSSKKIIICWAMGLTQHENGVDNIRQIVNLLLLKGAIGKEGAGTCPVRGHSNVQGDRTMGIWEAPPNSFLDSLEKHYKFKVPREHGLAVVSAIHAMYEGKAKFFFAMGGNFLAASPDTNYTASALQNTSCTVQVSTKLNRSHLITGKKALILPCKGRTDIDIQRTGEQFVTCENSMGVVHTSFGKIKPVSDDLMSEVNIVCKMAIKALPTIKIDWSKYEDNYDLIREDIALVIPGFEDFNTKVRQSGGFYLHNGARNRVFNTPTGKAHFTTCKIPQHTLKKGEYAMMTIRSHDQFNTTIYGLNDRYRGIKNGRRVIFMNAEDIRISGFKHGDYVDLYSNHSEREREAKLFQIVAYPIPKGNVATYYPESNPLVPIESYARESHTPASKMVIITLRKSMIE